MRVLVIDKTPWADFLLSAFILLTSKFVLLMQSACRGGKCLRDCDGNQGANEIVSLVYPRRKSRITDRWQVLNAHCR